MKVCVLGSGAYGISLSSILNKNKISTCLWTFSESECEELKTKRISPKLEGYKIPSDIEITTNLEYAVKNSDLIVIAVPGFAFEEIIIRLKHIIKREQSILIATKGIQQDTCLFLSDILTNHLKNKYAVISGPTFAIDIVRNARVGFSLATKSTKVEILVRKCFENDTTKFRRTKDVIGIEICGSIKNVIAIASGVLSGMKVPDSTKALFLTESLNDIKELIHALGGNKKSILSYAGFGDILMTCTSNTSRNYSFGYLIGNGASMDEVNEFLNKTTVEGMYTLKSIHKLVRKRNVKMPIINLIYDIVNGKKDKEELLEFLIVK